MELIEQNILEKFGETEAKTAIGLEIVNGIFNHVVEVEKSVRREILVIFLHDMCEREELFVGDSIREAIGRSGMLAVAGIEDLDILFLPGRKRLDAGLFRLAGGGDAGISIPDVFNNLVQLAKHRIRDAFNIADNRLGRGIFRKDFEDGFIDFFESLVKFQAGRGGKENRRNLGANR